MFMPNIGYIWCDHLDQNIWRMLHRDSKKSFLYFVQQFNLLLRDVTHAQVSRALPLSAPPPPLLPVLFYSRYGPSFLVLSASKVILLQTFS